MTQNNVFPYRLESCVWEITLACCFNCVYCGSRGGKARENELTLNECLDVAEQLRGLGCRRVSLIGGEVFMRRDWPQIVRALTGHGIKTCVITNGFTMSAGIVAALKDTQVESVAVSLDGPERVHDALRHRGSYARALEAISVLTQNGIPVSVISALRSDNWALLGELYETLKGYPIFAWQLQACSPMGNAAENGLDVLFDAESVMSFVARTAPDAPFYIGVADNIGYYSPEEGRIRGPGGFRFEGCGAGLTSIGIDSVGNVRGCESMYDDSFIEGNLRERTLHDIWEDERSFAYNRGFRRSMLTGGCAECEYGGVCAGGCRSYNYFANGGRLYESPLCRRSGRKP